MDFLHLSYLSPQPPSFDAIADRRLESVARLTAMQCTRLYLFILVCSIIGMVRCRFLEPLCQGVRPGDCDPHLCGGSCEARYIRKQPLMEYMRKRFYDVNNRLDRTAKSCQCVQEKICSIIGMHAHAGCRTYSSLSTAGQRVIRLWSIDQKDRRYRFSNDIRNRFSDKLRHHQLMNGNSRFCCRSVTPKRIRSLRLQAGSRYWKPHVIFTFILTYLMIR